MFFRSPVRWEWVDWRLSEGAFSRSKRQGKVEKATIVSLRCYPRSARRWPANYRTEHNKRGIGGFRSIAAFVFLLSVIGETTIFAGYDFFAMRT